ncbi:MAG: S1 RNA-binding domain-containing protein, partial [Polyangiales bacterium]
VEGAAAADGAALTGDAPAARKRRRRRRKKKTGDGTAHAADGSAPVDGAVEAEGEGEEGDESGEGATDGATEATAEGEGGEAKAEGDAGARKKRGKKPVSHHAHSDREKPPFSTGEEVICKVTVVMDDAIMLDVAGKALGIMDRREIPESETPAIGEQVIAKVSNDGARGGLLVMTKDLNRWQKSRTEVEAALANKSPVMGLVTGVIKGGVEVDVDGLRAFAPASHLDLKLGADLIPYIGQRLSFDVVQFAKRGREFVLSRKAQLEILQKAERDVILETLPVGEVVKGIVRSIQPFGAFVDIGGIDGLVPLQETSHTFAPIREVFKIGQEVEVRILKIDEKGKVWLSKRAAEKDPWDGAAERFARGTKHKGKIVRLQPFGAFIELEPGIDGLLHIKDIDAPKRLEHPSEVLKVGEEIEVVVSNADIANHKIGLHQASRHEHAAAGPTAPSQRLALHARVKCMVESQDINGLMVHIVGHTGRNAKAFIPAVATGTAKGTDLRKAFPVGKELEAKVIELDPRKGCRLSIKALATDEERQAFKSYQNEVKQASKFGSLGDLFAKKLK